MAAKVAAILARTFVAGAVERPQGRAGRIRLSAISRMTATAENLYRAYRRPLPSYQGKPVPCSSDFNSLFRRVGNSLANTLILLRPR